LQGFAKKLNYKFLIREQLLIEIYAFFLKNGKNMKNWIAPSIDDELVEFIKIMQRYTINDKRNQSIKRKKNVKKPFLI
jgi:hypothetical protein